MFSKIYLAALGLSITVMAFFTYYSWSWLQSIGQPAPAIAGYEYHSNLAWITLWITTAVLLLIGNAMLWTTRNAWAMWLTFVYFAVFVVIKYFWLARESVRFSETAPSFSAGPIIGVGLIIALAAVVFVDQFLVVRLLAKMYPEATDTGPDAEVDRQVSA